MRRRRFENLLDFAQLGFRFVFFWSRNSSFLIGWESFVVGDVEERVSCCATWLYILNTLMKKMKMG